MSRNILVTTNSDGCLQHWHATTGKMIHQYQCSDKETQFLCSDFSQDGNVVAAATNNFRIRLFDEATKRPIHTFQSGKWEQKGHTNRIFSLNFAKFDPNVLLSGGWDNIVHLWDLRAKQYQAHFFGPNICGDTLDTLDDGSILTGSFRDSKQLEVWDFKTLKRKHEILWNGNEECDIACVYAATFSSSD
jgi:COMPASS component SWD3